ncbi:MAG: serine hydrolase, partial [Bacteroidota bacterium]
ILRDKGYISGLEEKLYTFLKDYPGILWNAAKKEINLYHLLSMTSGLDWNESRVSYSNILFNDSNLMMMQEDWIRFALKKKLTSLPGSEFSYSSAAPIILSYIIKEASGMSNLDFARQYFFEPLHIYDYYYQQNGKDLDILADIDMLPRDLLKIGQLVLRKGVWNGQRIVSSDWIDLSLKPQVPLDTPGQAYGLSWWIKKVQLEDEEISYFYAWGYGGQHIFIVPRFELVVVTTGGWYQQNLAPQPFLLLEEEILPYLV